MHTTLVDMFLLLFAFHSRALVGRSWTVFFVVWSKHSSVCRDADSTRAVAAPYVGRRSACLALKHACMSCSSLTAPVLALHVYILPAAALFLAAGRPAGLPLAAS